MEHQFSAQDRHYRENYAGASFDVVLVDGSPAGRLYVARWAEEIRIMDLALLPEFRGAGTGGRLIGDLAAEGRATEKRVTIHVERFNPAARLYDRLGFLPVSERGVHVLMQWAPADHEQAETST